MKYLVIVMFLCSCGDIVSSDKRDIHSWNDYHWNSSDVGSLTYRDNTKDSKWGTYIDVSMNEWNSLVTPVSLLEGSSYDVSVESRRSQQWLGLAQIYLDSSGHITSGKVTMNPVLFGSDYSDNAIQHVLCQEVGHVLGLTHIVGDTCMDDCSSAPDRSSWLVCLNSPLSVDPNSHDEEELNLIYSHDDNGPAPDAGLSPDAGNEKGPCKNNSKSPKCFKGWMTVHSFENFETNLSY